MPCTFPQCHFSMFQFSYPDLTGFQDMPGTKFVLENKGQGKKNWYLV